VATVLSHVNAASSDQPANASFIPRETVNADEPITDPIFHTQKAEILGALHHHVQRQELDKVQ
jgi:hypothetical protein